MPMTNNAITAEGLVKVYRSRKSEVRALDGLDLTVAEGRVLGLLGPNGAGKTTTVRILATLLRPDAGRATVAGFDVVKQAEQLRRVIGLSGQYAAVDENLTGRENLWMFGRLYQLPSRRGASAADELLEQFDLADAADRVVKTYSGGMRRRLDLASALIGRPRLLFLDEPTTGLDPRSRLGMWDVIRGLVREGTTLLLTTQYLEEADALADTIAVVDHGQDHRPRHGGRAQGAGRRRADRGRRPRPGRHRRRRMDDAVARRHGEVDARRAHAPADRAGERRRAGASSRSSATSTRRASHRRHRAAPADPRRRVPVADRPRGELEAATEAESPRRRPEEKAA